MKSTRVNNKPASALPAKIVNDLAVVNPILAQAAADPHSLTPADIITLLRIYQPSWHKAGKIEGILSLDSSAHGCSFCRCMQENAANNPELRIICGECYDVAQENYRKGVEARHTINLRIMSTVLFTVDELKSISAAELVRVNSSGEIENVIHARNMIRYAKAHPAARVSIWAKNAPAMEAAFDAEGKPENVIYIASAPRINMPLENLPKYADYQFVVFDSAEKIAAALENGAGECNGKKCRDCGYKCYYGLHVKGCIIAELLR